VNVKILWMCEEHAHNSKGYLASAVVRVGFVCLGLSVVLQV
jgi:hypothetical protein